MVSKLTSLYKKILLIRLVEEAVAERYQEREMRCPVHLSIGQEAVAAGVCEKLKKDDIVYSTHRCHAHYLAKGGDLNRMIAEIYGKETGCAKGRGGSMHLIDLEVGFGGATPIVGNSLPVSVGAAFANKLKGNKKVVVAFLGDGTTETGVFHESLNFAVLHNLSILFVCENNFFSVYTHIKERQHTRPIYKLVQSYGMEALQSDGNDVESVYKAASKAIKRIRSGKGPIFLEFLTYRHREHCGPFYDDHLSYRDQKEVKMWFKKDPVKNFENYLLNKKYLSSDEAEKIKTGISKNISKAFQFAKKSPFPKLEKEFEKLIYAS